MTTKRERQDEALKSIHAEMVEKLAELEALSNSKRLTASHRVLVKTAHAKLATVVALLRWVLP
jgi:hypothetical protein